MLFDWLFWLIAITGVILTGISKSGFAGGAGVVAVPLMSLYIPFEQTVVIMLPLLIVMDYKMMRLHWRNVPWPIVKQLLFAAIAGIVLGGAMMNQLSGEHLMIMLALLSILFSIWGSLAQWLSRFKRQGYFWGGFSGLSSTLLHAGGPPINIYLVSLQMPKLQWLAATAAFFGVMNWIKVVPYTLNGLWQWELVWVTLGLFPFAYLGVILGHHIQKRISETRFLQLCKGLLFFSGLGLLVKAYL